MELVIRAASFAADRHKRFENQELEKVPYINSRLMTAEILCCEGHVKEPIILAAAILEKTLETGGASLIELAEIFGDTVASLVEELSDIMPSSEQPIVSSCPSTVIHVSPGAKMIKLADMICDLRLLVAQVTTNCSRDELHARLHSFCKLADHCALVNLELDDAFNKAWAELMNMSTWDETTYQRCVVEINGRRLVAYSTHDILDGVTKVYDMTGNLVAGWTPTSENMTRKALVRNISAWLT